MVLDSTLTWYMMWWKKVVLQGIYLFSDSHIIFEMVCPSSAFWMVSPLSVGLAVVRHPVDAFHMDVVNVFHMVVHISMYFS